MKRFLPLLIILPLLIWVGCEEEQDTTPPSVTIISSQDGSTVSDSVTITCMSSDDEGVEKVELWVDGVSTGVIDDIEPYSLVWNTTTYENGTYTIVVRSYDTSGNTTDSDPITLTIYKTVELWGEYYSILNTTVLDLVGNGLTGPIPPEIGNLTNLTYLGLNSNQLTGSIPPEIGNLTNLTELVLFGNELTGEIPSEIGNLTNLTNIYLGQNQLTGSIPSEIGNLTNLTFLSLHDNQLTGLIPSEIGNLTNLIHLYLSSNQLTGSIPSEIGNLTNLEYLRLDNNQLTGEIPPEIGNLTNLTHLYLNSNELTGEIPESICELTNLNWSPDFIDWSYSYLYNNQLCPPYPSCVEDYVGGQDTSGCD